MSLIECTGAYFHGWCPHHTITSDFAFASSLASTPATEVEIYR